MYHIKNDQRAQRSAETIYRTLVALMSETRFDAIRVSDIVRHANIGRSTFYRNFDQIEDVLRWRCDHVVDDLKRYLLVYANSHSVTDQMPFFKPILRYFYLDSTIIELLIAAERTDMLQSAVPGRLLQFRSATGKPLESTTGNIEYWLIARASVMVGVLVHWVTNGKREATDALADGLFELTKEMEGQLGSLILNSEIDPVA